MGLKLRNFASKLKQIKRNHRKSGHICGCLCPLRRYLCLTDAYEGYASLHPRLRATRSARAFDLSGRAAVKRVTISLGEADFARQWYTTPVAALPLCGANHKSASPRLSGGLMGLRHLKHKLDHRDNDSRAIFSFVSQFLSDSNKKSIDATLGWLHLL